ncbi:MAG: NAD(P)-dependent oxidoreductase [Chloroflexi bacterium]|nr:NAD(P)-dependent oxidoreductase [Chloroflexota bacterium]
MILLIGGGGRKGRHLTRDLVDRGQRVVVLDRRPFEVPPFLAPYLDKEVKVVIGDMLELPLLYRIIEENNVDSIIHLGFLGKDTASFYQTQKANVDATTEVLEAARVFGLRRVTYISTVGAYFVGKRYPPTAMHEDMDLPLTANMYSTYQKKASEQICLAFAQEYGLSIPIIRPGFPWGPLALDTQFVAERPWAQMVENAVAGKPSDYSHICGVRKTLYIYFRDLAKAISLVHLAPSLRHNVYNASDGESHSLVEFADAVREVIPEAEIKLGMIRSQKDVDLPPMSYARIKEDVGFTPDYDVRRGVRAYIEWLRERKYS